MSRPQIIMMIKDRNVTVYTCTDPDCKWSRLDLGNPIIAEQEAMTHLKTHAQGEDNPSNG